MSPNQVIEIEEVMLSKHCILFCANCETETKHVLGKSGEYYSCGCGSIIDIEFIEDEEKEV